MKKRSVMMALGLVMTLTACGGGNAGTTAAPSSGSETQTEAKAEEKTEGDTTAQEENKEESKTEASGDTVTLKLSNNQPDGNCTTIAVEWFADQVRERTDGRVNIEVYNNGTLGDAISCLEQLQYGGMDIVKADLSTMTNFVDEYNALMMPYIYKNTEHFWKVHGGDIGMGILRGDKMKEKKLYGLTYYDGGTRCFYNTKKEIHSPADMKGMLVRVQQSELMMSMVEALGGQRQRIPRYIPRSRPALWTLLRIPSSIIWTSPILKWLPTLWRTIIQGRPTSWSWAKSHVKN